VGESTNAYYLGEQVLIFMAQYVLQEDKGLPVNFLGLERIFYPQNGVIPLESIKSHFYYRRAEVVLKDVGLSSRL
jgi:hypothetical protein